MKKKWIVPPGLKRDLDRFDLACKDYFDLPEKRRRPFLIHGDTGVGKSLFVEYFNYALWKYQMGGDKSTKGDKEQGERPTTLRKINCAAIPTGLIESELFGHTKGAFTSAANNKRGAFELVEDGVLSLEEIGEMEPHLQAKLLIVVEEREFTPVGDENSPKPFKGHLIATTNVPEGKIRPDLWNRFDVFEVTPVYKRRSDVLYYLNFFDGNVLTHLTHKSALALLSHPWPGNVREIEKVATEIRREWMGSEILAELESFGALHQMVEALETYTKMMKALGFNLAQADEIITKGKLGVESNRFYVDEMSAKFIDELISENPEKRTSPPKEEDRSKVYFGVEIGADVGDAMYPVVNSEFDTTFLYYLLLCNILFLDPQHNENIFGDPKYSLPRNDLRKLAEKLKLLSDNSVKSFFHSALSAYCGFRVPGKYVPLNNGQIQEMVDSLYHNHKDNAFLAELLDIEKTEVTTKDGTLRAVDVTEKDLLRYYYHELLRTVGTKTDAAKVAGIKKGNLQGTSSGAKNRLGDSFEETEDYKGWRIKIVKE
jgi:hypothetical protein